MNSSAGTSQGSGGVPDTLFPYIPSKAAPYVFAVVFAISGLGHAYQTYLFKSWRFTILLPWGAAIYVAGFAVREVATYYPGNLGIFIAFQVLHYAAPPVYQAVNYFILGRVLHYIPYLSPIHPGRVVSTFIGLDVVVEILVAQGASRLARWDQPNEVAIGIALVKSSLLLQVALFLGYVALQIIFHRRCIRQGVLSRNLRSILIVLYISNGLILFRNVYRVVDTFLGSDGATRRYEVYEYVFDTLPIFANSILLNVFFPAVYLPRSNKVYIGSDGRTERHGPGWQDKRPLLLTIFDPFDLVGLVMGKDSKTRFWEQEQDHAVVVSSKEDADSTQKRSVLAKIFDPLDIGGCKASFSKPADFKEIPAATA